MNYLQEHLMKLYSMNAIPEIHVKELISLKENGFNPKVIYDIGSCVLSWTSKAKVIWPDSKIILFDAFSPVEFMYEGYDYHIGALSNSEKMVKFYQNNNQPGGNSYFRETFYGDKGVFPENSFLWKKTRMLDSVVKENNWSLPDLVKIDVQGSEKDIIEGGENTIKNTKYLIVEMQSVEYNQGAPMVTETMPYIESLGFTCIKPKFCDNGPDADYLFINNSLIK